MVGNSLELLCDVYEMDFPELEEVREANRIEEEEQKSYQHGIWQEIRGEAPPQEKFEMILNPDQPKKPAPVQSDKPGRNDACPCGSGKKFKKCCGKK
ncbi:MAG: hypothetical protein HPY50_00665 [Firmicutes bacterium]|nr:hypothetical protein [Bacillota bacterium]